MGVRFYVLPIRSIGERSPGGRPVCLPTDLRFLDHYAEQRLPDCSSKDDGLRRCRRRHHRGNPGSRRARSQQCSTHGCLHIWRAQRRDGLHHELPSRLLHREDYSERQTLRLVPVRGYIRSSIKPTMKHMTKRQRRAGTSLVEAALTLGLFTSIVFSIFDFGYVMYMHQTVANRVQSAARYGSLNPTDTTGMTNYVLYNSSTGSGMGIFGITTSSVTANRTGSGTT